MFLGSKGGVSSSSWVPCLDSFADSNRWLGFKGKADAAPQDDVTGILEFELVSLIPICDCVFSSFPNVTNKTLAFGKVTLISIRFFKFSFLY